MIDLKEQAGVAMNVRGQFSDSIVDPKVTLGALAFADELGSILWRIKYGQQRGAIHRAVLLLGRHIRSSGKFGRAHTVRVDRSVKKNRLVAHQDEADVGDIIDRFALQLLIEWLNDQCRICRGRGIAFGQTDRKRAVSSVCQPCAGKGRIVVVELYGPFIGRSRRMPGRVTAVPRFVFDRCDSCHGRGVTLSKPKAEPTKVCAHCSGSGREPVSESARASALGISLDQYHRGWSGYFSALHHILDRIDATVVDVVKRQLRS